MYSSMTFKAVIFDLDGTLIDSAVDIADSLNIVLENYNLPTHSVNTYKNLIGNGIKQLVNDALPEQARTAKVKENCIKEMFEHYNANCLNKTQPYDGINEMLTELDSKGIKTAVLSNKADAFTRKMVAELFPKNNFKYVVGVTNETDKKPNPINALRISKDLGVEPQEIIYLGDSGVDMQTAVNAGMYAVGALWGFKSKEEIIENGAEVVIKNPLELLKVLKVSFSL